jgi:hypothetical protein
VTAFLLFAGGLFALWLAYDGFRTGVVYGQAADVTRDKNPRSFNFVSFTYFAVGVIALGTAAYEVLT